MSSPIEEGMTYVEKLDFRQQAFDQKMELEREQTRRVELEAKRRKAESRHEMMTWVGVGMLIVVLILGVVYAIYRGTRPGPYSNEPSQTERREATCMDHGGTWMPAGVVVGDDGICVLPGKVPTIPSGGES